MKKRLQRKCVILTMWRVYCYSYIVKITRLHWLQSVTVCVCVRVRVSTASSSSVVSGRLDSERSAAAYRSELHCSSSLPLPLFGTFLAAGIVGFASLPPAGIFNHPL